MSPRAGSAALLASAVLVFARLWTMPLPSSLWLDEFGTVWVTDGGFSRVVERARLFPQSIPYAWIVALVRGGFGSSELVLRLPSLLAMLGAALLVARLGRACFGSETGALAAGAFLLFPGIEFAAADARPYAFGVLAATAALVFLKAWLDSVRPRDAAGYAVAAAAAVYFHYLFAAALLGHAVYAAWRIRRGTRVSIQAVSATAAGLLLLLLPAAALAAEIGKDRRAHEFGTLPGALRLLNALVPVRVLGLLLPALLVVAAFRRARGLDRSAGDSDGLLLTLSAALVPPAALFATSWALGLPVFEGRYLLETAPAWAALLGGALVRLEPAGAGRFTLAVALVLELLLRGEAGKWRMGHGRENWREALATVGRTAPEAPVLLAGSFAESRDPALAANPRHQEYLVEPVLYYAPQTRVAALPLGSSPEAEALARRLAGPALAGARFVLLERSSRLGSKAKWVDGVASPRGFSARELWREGPLRVRLYERSRGAD